LSDKLDEVARSMSQGDQKDLGLNFPRLHKYLKMASYAHTDLDSCCRSIRERGGLTYDSFWNIIVKRDPLQDLHKLKERAADLKQDIKTTIKFLDSQVQKELAYDGRIQAQRATALTTLAAIYLPLSLTTGVFGMNIAEINGGAPRYWIVLVLGLGALLLSIPILIWVFRYNGIEYRTLGRVARNRKGHGSSGGQLLLNTMECGSVIATTPKEGADQTEGHRGAATLDRRYMRIFRDNHKSMAAEPYSRNSMV
jgi:hypothetical protein